MNTLTLLKNSALLTCHEDHLNINFKEEWYQEEISALIELIISPIMPIVIQEKSMGADRENIRFCWDAHYFVLNFDYYSQSSWIEGQDQASTDYLTILHSAIVK